MDHPAANAYASWWALSAIGSLTAFLQGWLFLTGQHNPAVFRVLLIVGIATSVVATMLLAGYLLYLLIGKDWIIALGIVGSVASIALSVMIANTHAAGVTAGPYTARLNLVTMPWFASVTVFSSLLLAVGLTVALFVSSRQFEPVVKARARMVGAAVLLWFVAKAGVSNFGTSETLYGVPLFRLMALTAALLAWRAYAAHSVHQ